MTSLNLSPRLLTPTNVGAQAATEQSGAATKDSSISSLHTTTTLSSASTLTADNHQQATTNMSQFAIKAADNSRRAAGSSTTDLTSSIDQRADSTTTATTTTTTTMANEKTLANGNQSDNKHNIRKNLKTEYKSNFTPFDQYVYNEVTDSFVKHSTPTITTSKSNQDLSRDQQNTHNQQPQSSRHDNNALSNSRNALNIQDPSVYMPSTVTSNNNSSSSNSNNQFSSCNINHTSEPWYKEVVKRNEKANEYRFKSEVGHSSPLFSNNNSDALEIRSVSAASPYSNIGDSNDQENRSQHNDQNQQQLGDEITPNDNNHAIARRQAHCKFTPSDYKRDHLIAHMANNNNFNLPKDSEPQVQSARFVATTTSANATRRAPKPTSATTRSSSRPLTAASHVRARSQSSRRQATAPSSVASTSVTATKTQPTSKSNQTTPTRTLGSRVQTSTKSTTLSARPTSTSKTLTLARSSPSTTAAKQSNSITKTTTTQRSSPSVASRVSGRPTSTTKPAVSTPTPRSQGASPSLRTSTTTRTTGTASRSVTSTRTLAPKAGPQVSDSKTAGASRTQAVSAASKTPRKSIDSTATAANRNITSTTPRGSLNTSKQATRTPLSSSKNSIDASAVKSIKTPKAQAAAAAAAAATAVAMAGGAVASSVVDELSTGAVTTAPNVVNEAATSVRSDPASTLASTLVGDAQLAQNTLASQLAGAGSNLADYGLGPANMGGLQHEFDHNYSNEPNLIFSTTKGGNMLADELAQAEIAAKEEQFFKHQIEHYNLETSNVDSITTSDAITKQLATDPSEQTATQSLPKEPELRSHLHDEVHTEELASNDLINGLADGLVSAEDRFDSSERGNSESQNLIGSTTDSQAGQSYDGEPYSIMPTAYDEMLDTATSQTITQDGLVKESKIDAISSVHVQAAREPTTMTHETTEGLELVEEELHQKEVESRVDTEELGIAKEVSSDTTISTSDKTPQNNDSNNSSTDNEYLMQRTEKEAKHGSIDMENNLLDGAGSDTSTPLHKVGVNPQGEARQDLADSQIVQQHDDLATFQVNESNLLLDNDGQSESDDRFQEDVIAKDLQPSSNDAETAIENKPSDVLEESSTGGVESDEVITKSNHPSSIDQQVESGSSERMVVHDDSISDEIALINSRHEHVHLESESDTTKNGTLQSTGAALTDEPEYRNYPHDEQGGDIRTDEQRIDDLKADLGELIETTSALTSTNTTAQDLEDQSVILQKVSNDVVKNNDPRDKLSQSNKQQLLDKHEQMDNSTTTMSQKDEFNDEMDNVDKAAITNYGQQNVEDLEKQFVEENLTSNHAANADKEIGKQDNNNQDYNDVSDFAKSHSKKPSEILMNVNDLMDVEQQRKQELARKSELARQSSLSPLPPGASADDEMVLSADQLEEQCANYSNSTARQSNTMAAEHQSVTGEHSKSLLEEQNKTVDSTKQPIELGEVEKSNSHDTDEPVQGQEALEYALRESTLADGFVDNAEAKQLDEAVDEARSFSPSAEIIGSTMSKEILGNESNDLSNKSSSDNDLTGETQEVDSHPHEDLSIGEPMHILAEDISTRANMTHEDLDSEHVKLSNHLTNSDDELILDPRGSTGSTANISPLRLASPSRYNEGAGLGLTVQEERLEPTNSELANELSAEQFAPTTAENRVEESTSRSLLREMSGTNFILHPPKFQEADSDDDDLGIVNQDDLIDVAATMSPTSSVAEGLVKMTTVSGSDDGKVASQESVLSQSTASGTLPAASATATDTNAATTNTTESGGSALRASSSGIETSTSDEEKHYLEAKDGSSTSNSSGGSFEKTEGALKELGLVDHLPTTAATTMTTSTTMMENKLIESVDAVMKDVTAQAEGTVLASVAHVHRQNSGSSSNLNQ